MLIFFNDPTTTEIYTLSLHDALPICRHPFLPGAPGGRSEARRGEPRAGAGQARARAVRPAAARDLDSRRYRQGDRQDDRAAHPRRHPDRRARTVNRRALFQVMTTLDVTGLVRPHLVEMTKREDNPNAAEFRLQPLERGYGYTLGNSLRRMLLSSLRGAAVWAFRLDGVVHEHQTIPGVVEDVHEIIQRLKQLTLVLAPDVDEAVMHIKHDKAGPVYARDIEAHSAVTVVLNREQQLIGIDDRDGTMRLDIARVYRAGFVVLDMHHRLVHIGREDQRELLQALDDLVHVLHHTGNGLVLVHHPVEPEGPHGGAPQRREQHAAQRVAEGVPVAPLQRLEPELGGIGVVFPLGHLDQVWTDQPGQIECRHHLE